MYINIHIYTYVYMYIYFILRNYLCDCAVASSIYAGLTGKVEIRGRVDVAAWFWRQSGSRILLFSGELQFVFSYGFQMIGWVPPILWRVHCFTQRPLILMLATSEKNIFTATFGLVIGQISEYCGLVNFIHKSKHQKYQNQK